MRFLRTLTLATLALAFTGTVAVVISATTDLNAAASFAMAIGADMAMASLGSLAGFSGIGGIIGAVVQNPIIGQARNSFATGVFSNWKGLKVMRSKAISVANPRTPAQQAVRRKMALLASAFRNSLPGLRIGFVRFQQGTTAWATFLQRNYAAMQDNGTIATIPTLGLEVSAGTLIGFDTPEVTVLNATDLQLNWVPNAGQVGANADDIACMVIVNSNTGATESVISNRARADGSCTFVFTSGISVSPTTRYVFFKTAAGDDVSDSQIAA
jgi:hypothetical protein